MKFQIFSLKSLFIKGVGIIIVANNDFTTNQLPIYQTMINALHSNNHNTLKASQKISSSLISLPSSSPKISGSRVKTIETIGAIDKSNHAKPILISTKPLFNTLDDITHAFGLVREHLKKLRGPKAQEEYIISSEVINPKRISAYYNPGENRIVVSSYSYSQIEFIKGSSTQPFFVIAGRQPASYTYADGHAYDYIKGIVSDVNPKFTENLPYKVKNIFKTSSNESQSTLVASRFLRGENLIVNVNELVPGKPLTDYGRNWVPVLFSAGEKAWITPEASLHRSNIKKEYLPDMYHIDLHLFEGVKISNGRGTELFSLKNNLLLIESYNKHFLKNPNYRVGNRTKPLISSPIYNDVYEVEALAREAQILDHSVSDNGRVLYSDGLIISGVLNYDPNYLEYPFLYVLEGSNLDKLLERSHLYYRNAELNGYTIETWTHNFDKLNNTVLGIKLANFDRYSIDGGNSSFLKFSQEWKVNRFQQTYNSNSEELKRQFPAFLEYNTDYLKTTDLKSLVFPLFENLYALSAENQQRLYLTSTTHKGNIVSKVVPYESIIPPQTSISTVSTSFPEMQPQFILSNISAKSIKGVSSLIPRFINKDELTKFSEHIYYTFNGVKVHDFSFVKISPVALYNSGDHSIAILENSTLAMAYRKFNALRVNYNRDFQFIRFSSNIPPANFTLFSEDNFLKLIHAPTLLTLEESSYATSNTIFFNPDKWSILYARVSNPLPSSNNHTILIGLFKNVALLGHKFSKRVKFFERELFYELLKEY